MKLIFLGPPGAGKGTQALGVSSRLNVPHISTGNMLRAAVRNETPMGLAAKKFMDAGKLVPDEVLIEMVRERLSMADCKTGYLLDGFPRTVEQAEALEEHRFPGLRHQHRRAGRTSARPPHRAVGCAASAAAHSTSPSSPMPGVCPVCGWTLTHRDDDQPVTIRQRLKVYHEQTAPLIGYYEGKGKLRTVNGDCRPRGSARQHPRRPGVAR